MWWLLRTWWPVLLMTVTVVVVTRISTGVDRAIAELDDIKTEQAAQRIQLDRHEQWHHQTAEHLGLTLSHEA